MIMDYLLDGLDIIECFGRPGHRVQLGEITKNQKALYAALVVKKPSFV
jgi:hypothetical protein